MGNCQAVDAAALVIQHPSGEIERMYGSICANEVMTMNPGHYVSLIIPLPSDDDHEDNSKNGTKSIRFTRVKLLRPTDTLVLGRAYRLVTTQEVVKVLRAKKDAKMKKNISSWSDERLQDGLENKSSSLRGQNGKSAEGKNSQGEERLRQRQKSTNVPVGNHKPWRPSLQSIYESAS